MCPKYVIVWPPCTTWMLLTAKGSFIHQKARKISAGTYHLVHWGRHRMPFSNTEGKFTLCVSAENVIFFVSVEHWLSKFCFIPYCHSALKSIPLGSWTSFTHLISKKHWEAQWHGRLFSFSVFCSCGQKTDLGGDMMLSLVLMLDTENLPVSNWIGFVFFFQNRALLQHIVNMKEKLWMRPRLPSWKWYTAGQHLDQPSLRWR